MKEQFIEEIQDVATELLENILGSDSILEICRRFLLSEINDVTHTVAICSFQIDGSVTLEHVEGLLAGQFEAPENIWETQYLGAAIRSKKMISYEEAEFSLHIIPLLKKRLSIGAAILISPAGKQLGEHLRKEINLMQLLGGFLLSAQISVQALEGKTSKSLTSRQLLILENVRDGLTNGRIATKLHVSASTIGQELVRVYRILGVSNRVAACEQGATLITKKPPDESSIGVSAETSERSALQGKNTNSDRIAVTLK